MAVPTYSDFTTTQTATPDVNLQVPGGPTPGQIGASQADATGRAASGIGDAASRIALSMQEQINQTRVNDAMNQARIVAQQLTYDPQTGYKNQLGHDALQRPSGQPLSVEYGDKLNEAVSQIAGNLGNDEQRRAFSQSSAALATQFQGDVEAHTLQQFGVYHDSVNDATVNLAKSTIAQNWDNPDVIFGGKDPNTGQPIPGAIDAIKAATMAKFKQHGLEGAPADAAILDAVSSTHRGVVQAALENGNPGYAASYMEAAKKRGEMTGNDLLAMQARVNQNVWLQISAAAVSKSAIDATRIMAPTPMDRMKQITLAAESNGLDTNTDGTPVTSATGAKYAMQVQPTTAANPGHGIAPAANDSAVEYNRVGSQLLAALVKKYGDPAKAWAAYNAGEGNVDKAIAAADSQGDPGIWLQALGDFQSEANHKQTVDYVMANMAKFNNPSSPQKPTEDQFVEHALSQLPASAAPQLVQMTRQHAAQQWDVINKSMQERGQNALGDVQRWLYANQGHGATVADVPAELMEPLLQFAPADARNLEAFSKALQRGDVVTNLGLYNDVVTNMDSYARMSDPAWDMLQTQLSPGTFQALSKERANYINGKTDDSQGSMNRAQITRSLNEHLESLRLPTTAKPNTPDAAWLGATRIYVDRSIFQAQNAIGKKLTPAEIEDHINSLFAKDVTFKSTLFGIPTGTTTQNLMSMHVNDLPSGAYQGIKSALIKTGNKAPSDADILNTYRAMHGQQ